MYMYTQLPAIVHCVTKLCLLCHICSGVGVSSPGVNTIVTMQDNPSYIAGGMAVQQKSTRKQFRGKQNINTVVCISINAHADILSSISSLNPVKKVLDPSLWISGCWRLTVTWLKGRLKIWKLQVLVWFSAILPSPLFPHHV